MVLARCAPARVLVLLAVAVMLGLMGWPVGVAHAEPLTDDGWELGRWLRLGPRLGAAFEFETEVPPPARQVAGDAQASAGPRVGIQAGHWRSELLPEELSVLRRSTGAEGKGWREADINLDIVVRVIGLLAEADVQVDLLPATVPVAYRADAFVSIHGDANKDAALSGYKVARYRWSAIPEKDDALVSALAAEYGRGTGLPEHPSTITENMRQYYAFNPRLEHSVDWTTPAAILEMGFLTNSGDLALLKEQPDRVAQAIANGILRFLAR